VRSAPGHGPLNLGAAPQPGLRTLGAADGSGVEAGHGAPRVAAYARANTDSLDLEQQLAKIREWVNGRGFAIVAQYTDLASRRREGRAGFRRLLADAARRPFEMIVIQRLDCAARNVRELVATFDGLRRCGVDVASIADDMDTSASDGKSIFRTMAAIGQFQRALAGARTRTSLARARAQGVRLGRPRATARPEQAEALRRAGYSISAIARQLHCSPATVRRRLREAERTRSAPNKAPE
jgi:DNA invertase Pin-like site-specific DNA recombinase